MCRNSQRSTAHGGGFGGNHEVQQALLSVISVTIDYICIGIAWIRIITGTVPSLIWNQVKHGNHAPEPRETSRDQ